MSDTLRTFIALTLPQPTRSALGRLQEGLRGYRMAVRWVQPDNIHLTLKFLGDIPAAGLAAVGDALAAAVSGTAALNLGVRGIGVFPGIKGARVLWVGLCGDTAAVLALQQAIETRLAALGYAREKRAFKVHLTLGRIKGTAAPALLAEAIDAFSAFSADPFVVDGVTLFKSDLRPSGAVYTPLRRLALTAAVRLKPEG